MSTLLTSQVVQVLVDGPAGGPALPPLDGIVLALPRNEIHLHFPDGLQDSNLQVGAQVRIRFGNALGMHVGESRVLGVGVQAATLTLAVPARFESAQQRRFFRAAARLPVSLAVRTSSLPGLAKQVDAKAFTEDMSAGGARIVTRLALILKDKVSLTITLPIAKGGTEILTLQADVVRVIPVTTPPTTTSSSSLVPSFSIGANFAYGSAREEDRVVRLMFDLQRRT